MSKDHAPRFVALEDENTALVNDQSTQLATLRGLFRFKSGERPPVPLDEVDPGSEILTRFSTGAMSISK